MNFIYYRILNFISVLCVLNHLRRLRMLLLNKLLILLELATNTLVDFSILTKSSLGSLQGNFREGT